MLFLIIFALIVCIVAFFITMKAMNTVDEDYSMDKSLKNLSIIYVIIVPVVIVIIGLLWFFFS